MLVTGTMMLLMLCTTICVYFSTKCFAFCRFSKRFGSRESFQMAVFWKEIHLTPPWLSSDFTAPIETSVARARGGGLMKSRAVGQFSEGSKAIHTLRRGRAMKGGPGAQETWQPFPVCTLSPRVLINPSPQIQPQLLGKLNPKPGSAPSSCLTAFELGQSVVTANSYELESAGNATHFGEEPVLREPGYVT